MAADYMEVDTQELEHDRQTIETEVRQIGIWKQRLEKEMALLWSMWDGPAHEEFRRQMENDREVLEQFLREIESLMQMMTYAVQQYHRCEEQVEQALASVRI